MKDQIVDYSILALTVILIVIASVALVNSRSDVTGMTRFEHITNVYTQDMVPLKFRIIGSHEKDHPEKINEFIVAARTKFAETMHKDVPKQKLRFWFGKELKTAEDTGLKVDSISFYLIQEQ